MNLTLAKVISYVLQPLAMAFFTVLLVFNVDPYLDASLGTDSKRAIYSVMGLNTFLVPTLLIIYLKRLRVISSLDVEKRQQRIIPFVVTLLLYITTYILLRRSPLPEIIYTLLLAAILSMVFAFVITLFWKISIHMTGIGGVIGTMCALFQMHMFFVPPVLAGLVLIAGFIGTARMALGVHTLSQVVAGTILGITTQYLCISYEWVI